MTTPLDTTKLALVYLRQSTPGQVRDNVTSTAEQYRLREIPEGLGFAADRILLVDEDLGVSGSTIVGRKGMLRVLELLERGGVACVVVRDVARLTRDEFNTDIGLIARACVDAGAVIITRDKIYDPAQHDHRLELGLQGLLAGWDRSNIKRRLDYHRRARQARGVNINGAMPVGYERILDVPKASPEHGKLRITDDDAVRARIAWVLRRGRELGGVLAVLRALHAEGLTLPARHTVDGRRVVEWQPATRARVTEILKNPTYAGAIVNSRRARILDRGTGRYHQSPRRPYAECTVILDAHPAYITWQEHQELLGAIARNYRAKVYGDGSALISGLGLLRCGVCALPLVVQYNKPTRLSRGRETRTTPYTYTCTGRDPSGHQHICQNPAGPHIDRAVSDLVLFALGALDLTGAVDALNSRHQAVEAERRRRAARVEQLARRASILEGAIGDAERADARARLVARFEAALAELQAAQAEAAAPVERAPALTRAILKRLAVFLDPRAGWLAFTPKTRKEVLRALAERITVYPDFDGYFVVIDWRGGRRAAAKVKTMRRRKLFAVPEDVLALFGPPSRHRSIAARSWTDDDATLRRLAAVPLEFAIS